MRNKERHFQQGNDLDKYISDEHILFVQVCSHYFSERKTVLKTF